MKRPVDPQEFLRNLIRASDLVPDDAAAVMFKQTGNYSVLAGIGFLRRLRPCVCGQLGEALMFEPGFREESRSGLDVGHS